MGIISKDTLIAVKDRLTKAKEHLKQIGNLFTKKKGDLFAILSKYNIQPDKNNLGQSIKAVIINLKGSEDFRKDIANLMVQAKKEAAGSLKTSNYDGADPEVLQLADDLKLSANLLSDDEATIMMNKGVHAEQEEKKWQIVLYFVLALMLVVLFLLSRKLILKKIK